MSRSKLVIDYVGGAECIQPRSFTIWRTLAELIEAVLATHAQTL